MKILHPLTFGSLFDGIGGFIIALERAGMECRWRSEIDKYCNAQMEERHPDISNLGDVRNVKKDTAEPVDLVCGGFPCTDLSVAGRRAGLAGEGSGLWYEFHRVIKELRPRWIIIENVPGLLSSWSADDPSGDLQEGEEWEVEETSDFWIIINALAELRYGFAWASLDAQYRGLAQRRKRVFIVANSTDWTYPAKVLFEPSCVPGDFETSREAGQRTAAPITASSPSRRNGGSSPVEDEFIIAGTLTGHFAGKSNQWAPWNETEHLVAGTLAANCGGLNRLNTRNNRLNEDQTFVPEIASSLTAAMAKHGGASGGKDSYPRNHIVAFTARDNGRDATEDLAPTMRSLSYRDSHQPGSSGIAIAEPLIGVRRLTPTECEILQGFPPGWTEGKGQSDTQRYKQLGNAVAVPVVQWIAERIMEVENA